MKCLVRNVEVESCNINLGKFYPDGNRINLSENNPPDKSIMLLVTNVLFNYFIIFLTMYLKRTISLKLKLLFRSKSTIVI